MIIKSGSFELINHRSNNFSSCNLDNSIDVINTQINNNLDILFSSINLNNFNKIVLYNEDIFMISEDIKETISSARDKINKFTNLNEIKKISEEYIELKSKDATSINKRDLVQMNYLKILIKKIFDYYECSCNQEREVQILITNKWGNSNEPSISVPISKKFISQYELCNLTDPNKLPIMYGGNNVDYKEKYLKYKKKYLKLKLN